MAVLVFVLWRTLKLMPQTKPVRDQARGEPRGRLGRHRRRRRGEGRAAARSSSSCATPSRSSGSARRCRRASCCTARPGTGKTLLAKAVAHESGAQFFSQSASLVRRDVRRPRRRAHPAPVPRGAQERSPAIIFIDELDAVGARRGSDNNSEREQTLNQLLVEMDGFASTDQVVVMAASNLLEKLDPALLRPGPLRPPGLRLAARRRRAASAILERPHAQQAAARGRRPRRRRPADERPDRRRPGEHLQRGGDLLRAPRRPRAVDATDFDDALERVVAGVQSSTHAQRRTSAGSSPTTRPATRCARELLARRRPRAQDLDRPARPGAGLRREPARRGQLPQDARGAHRPDDRAARRPRRRADRLRRGHHRRRRTTCSASRRSRTRWSTSTAWAPRGDAPQAALDAEHAVGPHAPHPRRGAAGARLRGAAPARCDLITAHREMLERSSPHELLRERGRSSAADIDRIMDGVPRIERRAAPATCASSATDPTRARRVVDSRRACSPGSITSASRSRTSTTRSPLYDAAYEHDRSSTARWSRSRASRPCCSTSARTTSSCCAARPRHAGRQVPRQAGPGHPPRRLPGDRHRRRRSSACRAAGVRADRRDPADRHPRLARGVLPSPQHGRRADRDRRARGGPLTWRRIRRTSGTA